MGRIEQNSKARGAHDIPRFHSRTVFFVSHQTVAQSSEPWYHRVWCCGSITWVFPITAMSRLFNNKRKKLPESFPQPTFPTTPTDVAAGSVSHQTQSNLVLEGGQTLVPIKVQRYIDPI